MSETPDLTAWAGAHGYHPVKPGNAHTWLEGRPDLFDRIVEWRAAGWGWQVIARFLGETEACPWSETSLRAAARRRGIR